MQVFKIIGIVFTSIGLVFMVLGVLFGLDMHQFKSKSATAEGVVIDCIKSWSTTSDGVRSSTSYPLVKFATANGDSIVFKSSIGHTPPKYHRGELISVLYNPQHPQNARIDDNLGMMLLTMIFTGMGLIFFLIGSLMWIILFRRKRIRVWLEMHGETISAEIIGVERNRSIQKNGIHPYCIEAQWMNPQTGLMHVFRSESIWFDPSGYIHMKHVHVKVDMNNPFRRYAMDTSFLPGAAKN